MSVYSEMKEHGVRKGWRVWWTWAGVDDIEVLTVGTRLRRFIWQVFGGGPKFDELEFDAQADAALATDIARDARMHLVPTATGHLILGPGMTAARATLCAPGDAPVALCPHCLQVATDNPDDHPWRHCLNCGYDEHAAHAAR